MKIIVTGAGGQLGHDVALALAGHSVTAIDIGDLDITDGSAVRAFVAGIGPDAVINCAAYTNVDGCESDEETAYRVNALGPRNFAEACRECGASLMQISTDFVFDGRSTVPYTEFDRPNPLSVYGKTKYAGEELVRSLLPRHFVVRTAWLYGVNGNNFVRTMLRLAESNPRLTVVDDQRGTPTYSRDLAAVMAALVVTDHYGIYHCTNSGECTWQEFASEIMRLQGLDVEVAPITTEQLGRPAPRPAYSVLRNLMTELTLGVAMRPWQQALAEYLELL